MYLITSFKRILLVDLTTLVA